MHEESPAYYHGKHDRDRVDVQSVPMNAGHEVVALHLLNDEECDDRQESRQRRDGERQRR